MAWIATVLFSLGWLGLLVLLGLGPGPAWWWPLALALGWYVADATSGIIHAWLDYRPLPAGLGLGAVFNHSGRRDSPEYQAAKAEALVRLTPFERIVFEFKNHHPRPKALGRRSLIVLVGPSIITMSLPWCLAAHAMWFAGWLPEPLLVTLVASLAGGALAQYHHGVIHRDRIPAWARIGHRLGLLLTPARHEIHHQTLDRDFATLCGWSNPLVNGLFRIARRRGWCDPAGLEPA
ncbi:MAG: hypothetical protein RLZZ127_889 [Planctomycetota bacterium]|jgi:sterol desaturase/sphingolipid hydroxylase (fatty acid hydroxylase superfamily)